MIRTIPPPRLGVAVALAATALLAGVPRASAQPRDVSLSAAIGAFNVDHTEYQATEFRIEVQPGFGLGPLRALASASLTSRGTTFFGAGLSGELPVAGRMVLVPSLTANHYSHGRSRHDLGSRVQFRSQALLAFRVGTGSRVGLALAHFSNAGLSEHNPGSESLTLYYTLLAGR